MSKVVHFEIAAEDPEKLSEFYAKVFGWEIKEWMQGEVTKEENRYWLIKAGSKEEPGADGGMYKRREPICKGGANAFVCNIAVSDIEKAAESIKANGGKVEEIMDIMNVGKSAYAEDPEGNKIGIFWSDPNSPMQDM